MSFVKININKKKADTNTKSKIAVSEFSGIDSSPKMSLRKLDVLLDIEAAEIYPLHRADVDIIEEVPATDLVEPEQIRKDDEQPVVLSLPGDEFYEVKTGESLRDISAKFGVDMTQLCVWNNIMDPDLVRVGDRIRIK